MFFKIEIDEKERIIINNKVMLCTDCTSSINQKKIDGSRFGQAVTTLQSAGVLGCIVRDIEYEQVSAHGYIWMMPKYILFEKNGYQLEIKNTNGDIKYKTKDVANNTKIKHTPKILDIERMLHNTSGVLISRDIN